MVGTFYGEGCHDGMVAEAPKEVITVPVRFQCQQCHMSFASKSAHTAHARSHARALTPRGEGGAAELAPGAAAADPYRCDVCCKTFAVPARLVRHYRTHTGERPFECEFCHKMFSVKENLQVHRRIHTKERPYRCQVCGRAFEHSGKLHRHMRIHTGERPHACSVCGKTFIQSGQLVIHLRTHTGEKPYRCAAPNCGKGFTCSKQLKVHSRTHTGEKPYHCDICFRDFGYNHVLKLHRVQHYGSKCYKCTICDDTFKSKKEMEAHIKGHADEMPDRKVAEREVRLETAVPVEIEFIRAKPSYSLADVCRSPRQPARQTSPTDFPSPQHSATRYAATVLVARERDSAEAFLPEYLRSSSSDVSVELRVPSQGSYAAPIAGIPPSPPPQAADKYCYEPLTIIHHGYFVPQPIPDYRPALETNSNIVRCVEAALAVAEDASSPTPPSSTPERSSSPEDAMALDFVSYKEMSNLPLRKRKVYMKQIQTPPVRLNSVIQFAKAS